MKPVARRTIALGLGAISTRAEVGPAFEAVFTDTRNPVAGGLFVALVGPNHDAHDYIGKALAGGANGLIVSRPDVLPDDLAGDVFVAVVANTGHALMRLAVIVRGAHTGRFIGITGSVGKTTVKDMAAAAVRSSGAVFASPGNWNNEIGVPLSLFATTGEERYVVLELGMSAPGEIAALSRLAMPNVAVVTSARAAHLEFFDSVDAIADAKAEIWQQLPPGGRAVACGDDPRVIERALKIRPRGLMTYGVDRRCELRVDSVEVGPEGLKASITEARGETVLVELPALGHHNAVNAAGALAVARQLDIPLGKAAASLAKYYQPAKHRLIVEHGRDGVIVLDDCYNANPASTTAALETLGEVAAEAPARGAVIGSMLELGPTADALHVNIGRAAAAAGVDWLRATGPHGAAVVEGAKAGGLSDARAVDDAASLVDDVTAFAAPGRWILLKGSRGERLERLLTPLGVASSCATSGEAA